MPPEIASAAALIRAHGPRAASECRYMIDRLARRGDADGVAVWRAILEAVAAANTPAVP